MWGNLKERDHLEDMGIEGRVILNCILKEIGWQTMGYIYVIQGRDKLQAVVNMVINLQVP
jgi:hypothetical protein